MVVGTSPSSRGELGVVGQKMGGIVGLEADIDSESVYCSDVGVHQQESSVSIPVSGYLDTKSLSGCPICIW